MVTDHQLLQADRSNPGPFLRPHPLELRYVAQRIAPDWSAISAVPTVQLGVTAGILR